jgi:hypothetical protein
VRGLFSLARQLLRGASDEEHRRQLGPRTIESSALDRVARLRDELHATANRVTRFGVEEHPLVEPIRIPAPRATNTVLGPEQLLFQLGLSANRLVALIEPLTPRDWVRTGRVGDRLVTLGEIVNGVLRRAYHDLLQLLQVEPMVPTRQLRLAMVTEARSHANSYPELPRYSSAREASRNVAF